MISRLKKLLEVRSARDDGPVAALDQSELNFASAALMVEAAGLDGQIDDGERTQIVSIMVRQFSLDEDAAAALLDDAERDAEDVHDLYSFTSVIRRHFDHDERVAMVGLLWEVCYADGVLHDFEANLLRRLAGLLYVTDQESGEERRRALARLKTK
jgi:uncharacterized tellurite resistance protein B-like protein